MMRRGMMKAARNASPTRGKSVSSTAAAAASAAAPRPAWVPEDPAAIRRMTTLAVESDLAKFYRGQAAAVVDWFKNNMPDDYFRETPMAASIAHIKALHGDPASASIAPSTSEADLGNGMKELSFLRPASTETAAADLLHILDNELPMDARQSLQRVNVFTSRDSKVALFSFAYGASVEPKLSLVDYLSTLSGGKKEVKNGPMLLRYADLASTENPNHRLTLRHKQCRLSAGLNSEHQSMFVERHNHAGPEAAKKYTFRGTFSGFDPYDVTRTVADKVNAAGFALRSLSIDHVRNVTVDPDVAYETQSSNMVHMEAVSPEDMKEGMINANKSWKTAQDLRWGLNQHLLEQRCRARTASASTAASTDGGDGYSDDGELLLA